MKAIELHPVLNIQERPTHGATQSATNDLYGLITLPFDIDPIYLLLGIAAFGAGYVDAVVGGGGLIQTPALLTAFPTTAPAILFGTNKVASIVGTSSAAIQYARRVRVPWKLVLPGAIAALIGAAYGAKAVTYLSPDLMRPFILILLIMVAIYTFMKKDFGTTASTQTQQGADVLKIILIGGSIGFYDGFFGPGTGSFFIFLFVRFLSMDFLKASVSAKILNVATNLAAISYFAANVQIMWMLGAMMALANLSGAILGSRMALRHGAGFVRHMFLIVVGALVLKMSYDLIRLH